MKFLNFGYYLLFICSPIIISLLSYAERELMMIKVDAPTAEARIEINNLVQIFRAHICDVGESSFTIAVTGDPGKVRLLPLSILIL